MASLRVTLLLFALLATVLPIFASPTTAGCPFTASSGEESAEDVFSPEKIQSISETVSRLEKLPEKWNTKMCNKKGLRKECKKMIKANKGSEMPDLLRAMFHDHQACALDGSLRFELKRGENTDLEGATEKVVTAAQKCKCSIADTFALCAVMVVKHTGGPRIKMTWGHKDARCANPRGNMPPGGGFPKGAGPAILRKYLHQYDDKSIVLLSSAHNIGHFHVRKRGVVIEEKPFTTNERRFTNEYFKNLRKRFFKNKAPKNTFQLPSDLALIEDINFVRHVLLYARNKKLYFKDFRAMMERMIGDTTSCRKNKAKRLNKTDWDVQGEYLPEKELL